MNLDKYKNRKWEDLNDEEKEEWNRLALKHPRFFSLFDKLSKLKKCYMCKTKFPDGLLNKNPHKVVSLLEMFKGDFLFHLKSTHGIDPNMFLLIVKKTIYEPKDPKKA